VITLANSIIGVSILAMPYCYKQCGIVLATLMIILSGTIVKLACHLLIKSAIMARRRNIENLAFHTHGNVGKLLVELGIIGYLIGTSIAFFVVMGDLGPPLIASLAGVEPTYNLRMIILTGLGLFVALPLSLLRNIDSLQYICASSILFYVTVVFRVVLEAAPVLWRSSEWMSGVSLWRPAGILQCFPIFSMALACQANVFEVYASLPDASAQKMNSVTKSAVNLCSTIYIIIGVFGYIAFYNQDFGGNILASFTIPTTRFIDFLKLGFVISVAVSFPLVVFPCRTSIHSLIFRKTYQGIGSTELVTDYIPPARFNLITIVMILITLSIGIVIPDIELVLGIVGSTMGSTICVIFPAVAFLKLTSKNTTERLAAQVMLVIGVITMILGTYVNLVEHKSAPPQEYQKNFVMPKPVYVPPPPVDSAAAGVHNAQENADGANPVEEKIKKDGEAVIESIVDKQLNVKLDQADDQQDKPDLSVKEVKVESVQQKQEQLPAQPSHQEVAPEPGEAKSKLNVNKTKTVEASDNIAVNNNDTNKVKVEKKEDAGNVAKNDPIDGDEKKELDAKALLKELEKNKKDQERVLIEQKKILSELKQHQLNDAAKDKQQQVPINETGAGGQQPVGGGGGQQPVGGGGGQQPVGVGGRQQPGGVAGGQQPVGGVGGGPPVNPMVGVKDSVDIEATLLSNLHPGAVSAAGAYEAQFQPKVVQKQPAVQPAVQPLQPAVHQEPELKKEQIVLQPQLVQQSQRQYKANLIEQHPKNIVQEQQHYQQRNIAAPSNVLPANMAGSSNVMHKNPVNPSVIAEPAVANEQNAPNYQQQPVVGGNIAADNNNLQLMNNQVNKLAGVGLGDVSLKKRGALCENDPNCEANFDRNPLQDSPLNQDLLRLQYIGGKRHLQEERRTQENQGNNSIKDVFMN